MIYLAGPMTPKDEYTLEQNIEQAAAIYFQLVRACKPAFCPQIGAMLQVAFDTSYETWMAYDFAFIDQCDIVLMLPRWETSEGARREHQYALATFKRIVYDVKELL